MRAKWKGTLIKHGLVDQYLPSAKKTEVKKDLWCILTSREFAIFDRGRKLLQFDIRPSTRAANSTDKDCAVFVDAERKKLQYGFVVDVDTEAGEDSSFLYFVLVGRGCSPDF